jgi:hypothetical protein
MYKHFSSWRKKSQSDFYNAILQLKYGINFTGGHNVAKHQTADAQNISML